MKITYHIPTEQYGFVEVEVTTKGEEKPDPYEVIKDLFRTHIRNAGEDV